MRNNLTFFLSIRYGLLAFLLIMATSFQASAQILVDDCNTGAFSISGANSINDISATGAIGGTRDVKIANTTSAFSLMSLSTSPGFLQGLLQVRPDNYPESFIGNYDIGWGDNDFLGGSALNLDASSHDRIVVSFNSVPWFYGAMTVRFNKAGDPDYCSASVALHGRPNGNGNYTFLFSSFAGLDPSDIDGISIGFSNCVPDTVIRIDYIQITGTAADLDGDGVVDFNDNCPAASNANQADADGDGIGNVCDACPNDANNDADGDGVCGNLDNCPASSNASQADADGDGIGDVCDACPLALPNITNFNVSNCGCASGFSPVTQSMGGVDVIVDCVTAINGDSDCDGTIDPDDVCPGGDDSGPCNATSFPGLNNIPTDWKCGNNNSKVKICHEDSTICVSPNAVQAHLNHGDFLGPCQSCVRSLTDQGDDAFDFAEVLEMELMPNPAGDKVTILLGEMGPDGVTLTMFDRLGRVVLTQTVAEGETELSLDLSAEKFISGEYFIRVSSPQTVLTKMLMIAR